MKIVGSFLLVLLANFAHAGVFNGTTSCHIFNSSAELLFYGKCNFTNGGNVHESFSSITFPVVAEANSAGNEYEAVLNVKIELSQRGDVVRDRFVDVDGETYTIYSEEFAAKKGYDWQIENKAIIKRAGGRIDHPDYGTFQW